MSNRGRQNVASFLTLDLGLDWRKVRLFHIFFLSFASLTALLWVEHCSEAFHSHLLVFLLPMALNLI